MKIIILWYFNTQHLIKYFSAILECKTRELCFNDCFSWSTRRLSDHFKIIAKYSDIAGCITLDVDSEEFVRRTLITLPAGTTAETCTAIVEHLERKNFKVVELENLEDE